MALAFVIMKTLLEYVPSKDKWCCGVMWWICFTDDKTEVQKDFRSNPPTKVKLPSINKPIPPPVKDKPSKLLPKWVILKHLLYHVSCTPNLPNRLDWKLNSDSFATFLKQRAFGNCLEHFLLFVLAPGVELLDVKGFGWCHWLLWCP